MALEVPLDSSETYRERVEAASAAAEEKARRLTGHGLGGDALAREVVAGIEVEDAMRRDGLPRDLPDPDGHSAIETLHVSTYAVDADPPREGEAFAAFASRMRNAAPPDLDEVVSSVARGKHNRARLFDATMAHVSDHATGVHFPGTLQGQGFREWPEAFSLLASAIGAAGLSDDMAASAREVASRRHRTYSGSADPSLDAMATILSRMDAIGQSVAFMDGGLPGARARAFAETFEGGARERHLEGRMSYLDMLVDGLKVDGHASASTALEYNDLDNAAWVEDFRGHDLLVVTDQNADFAVLVERGADGSFTRISMARHGRPLGDYEARHAARAWERVESDDAFHQGRANPADPMAPLPLALAAEAMLSGEPSFPGLLGRFAVVPGGLRHEGGAAFDARTFADFGALLDDVEFGALEVGCPFGSRPWDGPGERIG